MNEQDKRLIEMIKRILEKGNDIELRLDKDGSIKMYEVIKKKKDVS